MGKGGREGVGREKAPMHSHYTAVVSVSVKSDFDSHLGRR